MAEKMGFKLHHIPPSKRIEGVRKNIVLVFRSNHIEIETF